MFQVMFIFFLVGLSSLFSEVTDFHGTLVKLIWLKVNVGINCYYPFLNIFSILVATTSGTTTTYKPESTRMNTTIQSQTPGSTHTDTTIQSQTPGSSKEEDHVLSKDSLETNAVATSKSNFIIALSCFLCLCIT